MEVAIPGPRLKDVPNGNANSFHWESAWVATLEEPVPLGISLGRGPGKGISIGNHPKEIPNGSGHSKAPPQADSQRNCIPQGLCPNKFRWALAVLRPLSKEISKWSCPVQGRFPTVELGTPGPLSKEIPNGTAQSRPTQANSAWNWPLQGKSPSRFPMELASPGPPSPSKSPMELPSPGPLPQAASQ